VHSFQVIVCHDCGKTYTPPTWFRLRKKPNEVGKLSEVQEIAGSVSIMDIPAADVALFRRLHVPKATVLSMGRACQTPLTTKPLLPPAKPHLPLTAFAERCLGPLEQRPRTLETERAS